MKNITVREFLTEEEIGWADNREMLYEAFKYDGMVDEKILSAIEKVYGEDGLEKVSRKFAEDEFEKTLDMTLDKWIEYYGDNDTIVADKLEKIREEKIKEATELYMALSEAFKPKPNRRVFVVAR